MKPSYFPRLINPPAEDPGVYVAFRFERRALLFDLGSLERLSHRDLLKVTHVFVSHAHMDHFVGFDKLLRVSLGREKTIHLYGPPRFSEQVGGKLAGYHWNLVHTYPHVLTFLVHELHEDLIRTSAFSSRTAFGTSSPPTDGPRGEWVLEEPGFAVAAVLLDHRIPCLAFAMKESLKIQILKEEVEALGLAVGPWLNRFKARLQTHPDPGELFRVEWRDGEGRKREETFSMGRLAERIAITRPGMKIAYVTDAAGTEENAHRITALARGCDILFIEGAFLRRDLDTARKTCHLTAWEAGRLARAAGAKSFQVFHFSHRYSGREGELLEEARAAYRSEESPEQFV